MYSTMHFLARHWWSVILVAGAVVSVCLVYRSRSKYIPEEDQTP